ncbi:2-hydroxyacid dehydrogenase [Nocardioides sp.]|uniref:2-hydroxyacid dehydrogenase n=1 Tax=Nocardioides sp. TaxID=35761 RepID=UPI00260A8681|nr:2-hydroxyacid dehydrogenase [Nocardioides sp.]
MPDFPVAPSDRLAWVPFSLDELEAVGPLPQGLRIQSVDYDAGMPDHAEEVTLLVAPYTFDPSFYELLGRLPRLETVQVQWAGIDQIVDHVPAGVRLCNGRGIHNTATAELAVTLTLASLRNIPGYTRLQDQGIWDRQWLPGLADKRVVIVGAGAIGAAIRTRIEAFEAEPVMVARTARTTEAGHVHGIDELPALLPEADVVILILPATPESTELFDAEMIARMKPGALLVNVARGAIVDTDALVTACAQGRISAAIDVVDPEPLPADHPLWRTPGVLITPHIGGTSAAMRPRALRLVHQQLWRYANGEELLNIS